MYLNLLKKKPYDQCFQNVNHIVEKEENIKIMILTHSEIEKRFCNYLPKKLHVIVGQLVDEKPFYSYDACQFLMDNAAKFTYKIEQTLFGNFNEETIVFNAFEHAKSDSFSFANSKYALLFVLEHCDDKFTLVKYQAYNTYKTTNDRFAIRYKKSDYYKNDTMVMLPKTIDFGNLELDISEREFMFTKTFEPYYKIRRGKAIPKMGNYVEDVFEYWKTIDSFKTYFDK